MVIVTFAYVSYPKLLRADHLHPIFRRADRSLGSKLGHGTADRLYGEPEVISNVAARHWQFDKFRIAASTLQQEGTHTLASGHSPNQQHVLAGGLKSSKGPGDHV